MHDGLSLRQSLRALDAAPVGPVHPIHAPHNPVLPEGVTAGPAAALSPAAAEAVAADLLALFEDNRDTRDSARGLSAKIGRAVEDVRLIAEHLAVRGVLGRSLAADEVIYARFLGVTS
jgi:hypothetical protein